MIWKSLVCPACRHALEKTPTHLSCSNEACGNEYPLVDGKPVLIDEKQSVFSVADFLQKEETFFRSSPETFLKRVARALMPSISMNVKARKNYQAFVEALRGQTKRPKILVIGGAVEGQGYAVLANDSEIELVETDVAWGPRIQLICDIHSLPFRDGTFDGVVVQAVLEHVVDPYLGVEEVYRVLRRDGVVYAETPFMQQVHGGKYDFTRFSYLGHRRLFRKFEELASGAVGGPGMALAWSWQYFFWSFTNSTFLRQVFTFWTSWTGFFWKYFDWYLVDRPAALDAASGYFFLGRKSTHVLSDRELLRLYDRVHPKG